MFMLTKAVICGKINVVFCDIMRATAENQFALLKDKKGLYNGSLSYLC